MRRCPSMVPTALLTFAPAATQQHGHLFVALWASLKASTSICTSVFSSHPVAAISVTASFSVTLARSTLFFGHYISHCYLCLRRHGVMADTCRLGFQQEFRILVVTQDRASCAISKPFVALLQLSLRQRGITFFGYDSRSQDFSLHSARLRPVRSHMRPHCIVFILPGRQFAAQYRQM
jgi:hypothetical protein